MPRKPNARARHTLPTVAIPMAAGSGTAAPAVELTGDRARLHRDISRRYALEDGSAELLSQACQALERAARLAVQVEADGPVVRDRFGGLKPHPAIVLERDFRALAVRTLSQLVARMES
jgi:hypothetical protein